MRDATLALIADLRRAGLDPDKAIIVLPWVDYHMLIAFLMREARRDGSLIEGDPAGAAFVKVNGIKIAPLPFDKEGVANAR